MDPLDKARQPLRRAQKAADELEMTIAKLRRKVAAELVNARAEWETELAAVVEGSGSSDDDTEMADA